MQLLRKGRHPAASDAASGGEGEQHVFVSYSREDEPFVRGLERDLAEHDVTAWLDLEGIRPAADWWTRIKLAIEGAKCFVVVVSPDYLTSEVCEAELAYAGELNKRIVPLLRREINREGAPSAITAPQWIRYRDGDDLDEALELLVTAVGTDGAWLDQHARLLVRAKEWEREGHDRSFVLRGRDLEAAEQWLGESADHGQAPTDLQRDYVEASRHTAVVRRRLTVGAALASVVVAAVLGVLVLRERSAAGEEEARADSRGLAAASASQLPNDPELSLMLATEAMGRWRTQEAEDALRTVVQSPLLSTLAGHDGAVNTASFSPDGKTVVTGGEDGTARLWDAATGRELHSLTRHRRPVEDAAFSPDGKQIATAGRDGTVRVWDTGSGEEQGVFKRHTGPVLGVEFSPQGGLIQSLSGREWFLWEAATRAVETNAPQAPPSGDLLEEDPSRRAAFSGDGGRIAVLVGGAVGIWDVERSRSVSEFQVYETAGYTVDLDASGDRVVTTGSDGVAVWVRVFEAETGATLAEREVFGFIGAEFAGHGESVVTFDSGGGDPVVWDFEDDGETKLPTNGEASLATVSHDGRAVLTSQDGSADLWEPEPARNLAQNLVRLVAGGRPITAAAFSPDDRLVVTAGDDGLARVWDLGVVTLAHEEPPWHPVAFSADSRLAASATRNHLHLWEASTGRPASPPLDAPFPARTGLALSSEASIAFSPDGTHVALAVAEATARLWDIDAREVVANLEVAEDQALSEDASRLADRVPGPGERRGTVRVRELRTGATLASFPVRSRWAEPDELALSPDGELVAYVDPNGLLRVWEVDSGRQKAALRPRQKSVWGLAFSSDGRRVVTVGDDGRARLWDIASREPLAVTGAHKSRAEAVALSRDGRFIVTAGADGAIRVWGAATGRLVSAIPSDRATSQYSGAIAISPDSRFIAASSPHSIYTCRTCVGLDEAQRRAKSRVHRDFTPAESAKYGTD